MDINMCEPLTFSLIVPLIPIALWLIGGIIAAVFWDKIEGTRSDKFFSILWVICGPISLFFTVPLYLSYRRDDPYGDFKNNK